MSIPYFIHGGSGQPLHFLHANGYPPGCYKSLLDRLQTQSYVFGMLLRPLWQDSNPNEIQSWEPFTQDLLQFLAETQTGPVIGVGHSIGAIVTLRAALRDPGKFRALVLLDPVLFVPSFLVWWTFFRTIGLGYRLHPMISGALKRRRTFDDLEKVFSRYRTRTVFKYMSDEDLWHYIKGITRKREQGYELVFSPEWESRIYYTGLHDFDIWRDLRNLEVPTLFIRGAETDTFLEKAGDLVKRKQPRVHVETLGKCTHLLPLERPNEVADTMQSFLKSFASGSSFHPQNAFPQKPPASWRTPNEDKQ